MERRSAVLVLDLTRLRIGYAEKLNDLEVRGDARGDVERCPTKAVAGPGASGHIRTTPATVLSGGWYLMMACKRDMSLNSLVEATRVDMVR